MKKGSPWYNKKNYFNCHSVIARTLGIENKNSYKIVPSPTLLARLCRLEKLALASARQSEPTRGVYFADWSIPDEIRFTELWSAKELSHTDKLQLRSLLAGGAITNLRKDNACPLTTWNIIYPLIVAFHNYLLQYPDLAMPSLFELLHPYTLNTVARLLAKYGWRAGFSDCSTIRPLDEWSPAHRTMLIEVVKPNASAVDRP